MSAAVLSVSPFDRPAARCLFVSMAVNSTYPSPDGILREETAPAFQPTAAVLVRRALRDGDAGVGEKLVCPMRAWVRVEPVV